MLQDAGINFDLHKSKGIDHMLFAEYFLSSGLAFNDNTTWICFQGNQDFGYMYRVLANKPLPDSEDGFLDETKILFPNLYDIKYMKHEFEELRGGLSRLGDLLSLDRIGQQHQAGSDSWLTGLAFFKLVETYLPGKDITDYNNVLYGMGPSINDEQYLDNYTSKTEQLEREAREYQDLNDDYMHHDSYHYSNSYMMGQGYGGEYGNENMGHAYGYNNHLLHPSPHMQQHMGYTNSMSPNMHPGYGMSPNHIEYGQEGDNQMNMHYQMHYQMPSNRHGQDQNNMENYPGSFY